VVVVSLEVVVLGCGGDDDHSDGFGMMMML
jgi:hypothetical protein